MVVGLGKGLWNATKNEPKLVNNDGSSIQGDFYLVNVAGTQDLGNGPETFVYNNLVLYNGANQWVPFDLTPGGGGGSGITLLLTVAPLSGGPITTTGTISIAKADISHDGYLSQGDWVIFNAKMTNPMSALGDIIYGDVGGTPAVLAGNTTGIRKVLSEVGTGSGSTAPIWVQLSASDLSNGITGSGAIVLRNAPVLVNPVVGTQIAGDNSTKAASTAFVATAVAAGVGLVEDIDYEDPDNNIGDGVYSLRLRASYPFTINQLAIVCGSGTTKATISINGTPVTNLQTIGVSNLIVVAAASDPNTVNIGDRVTLTLQNSTTLDNLQATLKTTRL